MKNAIRYAFLTAGILSLSAITVTYASTATQKPEDESVTTLDHEPTSSLSSYFSAFAGSSTNAQDLVNGLRSGSSITLSGSGQTSVSFTPPTSGLGNGEVAISLGLAQQQLVGYGITDPSPQEIEAALVGGKITTSSGTQVSLTGVLTMRNSGMGWGEIAQKDGFNLGSIMHQIHGVDDQETSDLHATESQVEDPDVSGDKVEHEHADTINASVSAHTDVADPDSSIHEPDVDVERPQVERPDIQRPDIQRPEVPEVDH